MGFDSLLHQHQLFLPGVGVEVLVQVEAEYAGLILLHGGGELGQEFCYLLSGVKLRGRVYWGADHTRSSLPGLGDSVATMSHSSEYMVCLRLWDSDQCGQVGRMMLRFE